MNQLIEKTYCQYHITIQSIEKLFLDKFKTVCNELGGKAVFIQLPNGDYIEQPMLSLTVSRSLKYEDIIVDVFKYAELINQKNYKVNRIKVEVPAMDYHKIEISDFSPYFEWHCLIEDSDYKNLRSLCAKLDLHISKNTIQENQRYLTLRTNLSYEDFLQLILNAKKQLEIIQVPIIKDKKEYCIYDNNLLLDKGWIG